MSDARHYRFRRLTPAERAAVVAERRSRGYPWHSPPHPENPGLYRIVTAACFEHRPLLSSAARLLWFETELLDALCGAGVPCAAWCVLPNHYHALVQIEGMHEFGKIMGRLHGRTSRAMNLEDRTPGRRVWYRSQDRWMRSEGHFFASLNYIHHNPVKHGYCGQWQEWPFSSVHWHLDAIGRDGLLRLWRDYPVLNYGDGWDDERS